MNRIENEVESVIRALQTAAGVCEHPLLQSYKKALQDRAHRLAAQQYTIALFGAFSAGKSSLINALIGEQILPVSPNPTTATINRVLPPTKDYEHGTIRVVLKDRESVAQEVAHSAKMLRLPTAVETLRAALLAVDVATLSERLKPHYSYLRGIERGYAEMDEKLGQIMTIDTTELRSMVASEERAAFVERVDLYHESRLARAGVILVDTPGVDSLHARHTDVAFRYMRDADAIVFLTYYNHAFSQPDREFLMQLGRVKEALSTDTMFFVINASDLSTSEEELQTVKVHVEQNLARLGVRAQRLYAVSSQLGLAANILGRDTSVAPGIQRLIRQRLRVPVDAELPTVEQLRKIAKVDQLLQELVDFTRSRMLALSVQAAKRELAHVHESVEGYLKELQGDRATFFSEFAKQEQQANIVRNTVDKDVELDEGALRQEISELLYYVKQRIFFQHSEFIVQSFHPSSIVKGDAMELHIALEEWLRLLALAAEQEARSTGIRVARRAQQLVRERVQRLSRVANEPPLGYVVDFDEYPPLPDELPPHPQVEVTPQIQKLTRNEFRNAHHFFEQGGRKGLSDQLGPFGITQVERYLQQVEGWVFSQHKEWLHTTNQQLSKVLGEKLSKFLTLKRRMLDDEGARESLQKTLAAWPQVLEVEER